MIIPKIILRNAFRNKLRSLLTVLGAATAILAFCLLRTMVGAWYAGVAASSSTRLVTRNAVSLVFPLPIAYLEKIRRTDGVKKVSYGSWFGGIYIDEKNFFPNFVVEPRSYLDLYPEFVLSPDQREAFFRDRRGCVAGRKIADLFGWKIGDIVTLKGTIYPGDWDLILRGIYRGRDDTIDETQFFFHWEHLDESIRETMPRRAGWVGFYLVGVSGPEVASRVGAAIDETFRNSLAETLTETEKSFQQGFVAMSSALLLVIQSVSVLVVVIILAVVANTMVMTTRERMGEYAVFKCLGYGGGYITAFILGESLVITLTGCVLGIVLTFPAIDMIRKNLPNFFPVFNLGMDTVVQALGAALFVALFAAAVPSRRAVRVRIAEGLARIG
jgi:putative ABC transport system permease protein